MKRAITMMYLASCLLIAAALTSCDDGSFDHDPPEGKGSIIVDNNTGTDTAVYLDGTLAGYADSGDSTIFDLEPGEYRLVLDEVDGTRNYRDDIDVLEGRLTVLDVLPDAASIFRYYVTIEFD